MRFLFALTLFSLTPLSAAHAVPPPDFLLNVGSQLAQTFSIVCVCVSALCSVGYQQIGLVLQGHRRLTLAVFAAFVLLLSFIVTYGIEVLWS